MSTFKHYQPTKINFGVNEIEQLDKIVKKYGNRCLLVTPEPIEVLRPLFNKVINLLEKSEIKVFHYNKVTPNPYTTVVDEAIEMANSNNVDIIVALGGGSAIDTAKVVACYSNGGKLDWNSLFANNKSDFMNQRKTDIKKIPMIAISTTSGTGSQCTQAAVITNSENGMKTTLFNFDFFPEECIVDPKLMETLPYSLTASTAFDAFCHLTEAYLNGNLSPIVKPIAIEAIKDIIEVLPKIKVENKLEYREKLAIADTIAGITLSNGGANIPHSLGEILTSIVPTINHGNSLAIVYAGFIYEYFDSEEYGDGIIELLKLMNPTIDEGKLNKEVGKKVIEQYLQSVNLDIGISNFTCKEEDMVKIKECVTSEYCRFKDKEKLIKILENSF